MCPMIAGTISSLKFSEIQAQSMSLGSSKTSCKKARPAEGEPLYTWAALRAGERLYGFDGQQPLLAVSLYDASGATGPDDLRERILYTQPLAYAGEVIGVAIGRLELKVPDPEEREPL